MMTVDVSQLKFPVISYDERSISTHRRRYNLTSSIESYVDKGGFLGRKIIDSSGLQFEIIGLERRGWSIFNLLHPLFISIADGDRMIKIRLNIVYLQTLNFGEVYQEIDELFERHPRWLSKQRKSYLDDLMNESTSIKELITRGFAHGKSL